MSEETNIIRKYEGKIRRDKEEIARLTEENEALRQLLDCAAANISLLVKECGSIKKLSQEDVREALGKYRLTAERDSEGNYLLKLCEEAV